MKKMAGVLVGAVGIAAFVASPAHAVEWPSWPGEVENSAGDEGNFQSDGDWGRHPRLEVRRQECGDALGDRLRPLWCVRGLERCPER